MKARQIWMVAVGTLMLALAFTAAAPNAANGKASPAAASLPREAAATPAEPHPEIREAIRALRQAKEHMEHAAHDFGGHRVEAIRATEAAIQQLQECLKYDR